MKQVLINENNALQLLRMILMQSYQLTYDIEKTSRYKHQYGNIYNKRLYKSKKVGTQFYVELSQLWDYFLDMRQEMMPTR